MLHQRGLAGSRLAGDQNHGHRPGLRDRQVAAQRRALSVAPDKQPVHNYRLPPHSLCR
jgi:hypothetical protein